MQRQQPQQRSILRIRVPAPPPGFPSYVKACWVFTQLRKEFKNIAFGKIVWKSHWKELVDELGDAVQSHWSEWDCKEADDWTAREKLLLAFSVGKSTTLAQ